MTIHPASQRQRPSPSVSRGTILGLLISSFFLELSHAAPRVPFTSWSFETACKSMSWTPLASTELQVLDNAIEGNKDDLSLDDYELIVMGVPENMTNITELYEWYKEEHPSGEKTAFVEWIPEDIIDFSSLLQNKKKVVRMQVSASQTKMITLVGLSSDEAKKGRELGSSLDSILKDSNATDCAVVLPASFGSSSTKDCATELLSSLYVDKRYKSKPDGDEEKPSCALKTVHFVQSFSNDGSTTLEQAQESLQDATHLARGIYLTKDIVNAPHNILNTYSLAETALQLAVESKGKLKCRILELKDCEKRGMGAYLGVARGSETYPKFLHLWYKSKRPRNGRVRRKIGIIGKGLLFDTGGYSIKTGSGMTYMKFDCGGAAAVLGAARAIGRLQPEGVEAHFVIAACENMINERAIVPGDILTASNGKTIEVLNTDAEGRLTMADALVYVDKELDCERIIELSTLTGACMGALGTAMAGLFTSDDDLADDLLNAAQMTGEKLWRLPLEMQYQEMIQSKIADLKNIGGMFGGAITAALFLTHFVQEGKPFAHVDMAGPVWNRQASCASGWGAKLVTEWVCRQGQADGESTE